MRPFLLLLIAGLLPAAAAVAQTGAGAQQINEQVWKPFQRTYGALDAEGFLALHAADVVRVIRDGEGKILPGPAYRADVIRQMAEARRSGVQRTIDFSFTQRFIDGDHAFDAGYYRVVSRYGNDETYTFYGRFDVVLRRENGQWRILLDSDTSDQGAVGAADFARGQPMQ